MTNLCIETVAKVCRAGCIETARARGRYHIGIVIHAYRARGENFQQPPKATANVQNASLRKNSTHQSFVGILNR